MAKFVRTETRGHVLEVTLDRPPANAITPEVGRELDVLGGKLERKSRRIVFAGQELLEQPVERQAAAGDTLTDRFPQRHRVHAGLHAHGEGFGERAGVKIEADPERVKQAAERAMAG